MEGDEGMGWHDVLQKRVAGNCVRAEPAGVQLQWLLFAMSCDNFGGRAGCLGVEVCIGV